MRPIVRTLVLIICVIAARPAAAHFLWLQTEPAEKPAQIQLWFSETCVPGEAKLLDKVSQTKVWSVRPDGSTGPLTLSKHESGDVGCWQAPLDAPASSAVEASCDYGVISRGGATFLLQYYARHLNAAKADELNRAVDSQQLPLTIVPRSAGGALSFEVRFDNKPAAGAELLVIGPDNEERNLKLDGEGLARIDAAASGDYAVRARLQLNEPGERNGKKYDEVRHYSTLTFRLAGAPRVELAAASKTAPEPGSPEAVELLRRARAARAVWENFAGFSADVTVTIDGATQQGTLKVDDSGVATVEVADKSLKDWAEQVVESLVQHRLPTRFADEKPTFADEPAGHPLGRKILLGDADYQSAYRIQDDMITEVNRRAGPTHFTISVLETERNKDNKYLPRVVTLTTWDDAEKVVSATTVLNTWTRAGSYDVPQRQFEVQTAPGSRSVREITFSNYRLPETVAK